MSDIDSYLLKCALEAMEQGVPAESIEEECICKMGFKFI